MRLITVVMNEPTSQIRNSETTQMLDYGFNMYSVEQILDTKNTLQLEKVELGKEEMVGIIPTEEVKILNNNTKEKRVVNYDIKVDTIKAPIKVGDVVGKVDVIENGKVINSVDLTVKNDVEKANIFTIYYRNIKNMLKGF